MPELCTIQDCGRFVNGHGYCSMHYKRWRKYGDPLIRLRAGRGERGRCTVGGCGRIVNGHGYCSLHYYRWKEYGDPLTLQRREPGTGSLNVHGYVTFETGTRENRIVEYEHRIVWEAANGPIPDGFHIHHINHNRSDNRLENLALVSASEHRRLHRSWTNTVCDVPDCAAEATVMGKCHRHYINAFKREWRKRRRAQGKPKM